MNRKIVIDSDKMLREQKTRGSIFRSSGAALLDYPTCIYSTPILDEYIFYIKDQTEQYVDTEPTPSSDRLTFLKLSKLMAMVPTKQIINQIVNLLKISSSNTAVQERVHDFFINAIGNPVETIEGRNTSFDYIQPGENQNEFNSTYFFLNILKVMPKAIESFASQYKTTILNALGVLLPKLAPNPNNLGDSVPYQVYVTAADMLTKCIDVAGDEERSKFAVRVLSGMIDIAGSIAGVVRNTKTRLPSYAGYVGEFVPFISHLEKYFQQDLGDEVERLLQQAWIVLVLFSYSNTAVFFSQWREECDAIARFMPPLVHSASRGGFASVKFRVAELLKLIAPDELTRSADLVPIFARAVPTVSSKAVLGLELPDAVYALAIYALEGLRAERGIFGPMFAYIEGEYHATFSAVLDAMFEPLFDKLTKTLDEMQTGDRRCISINYDMRVLIERYTSPILRIQERVDVLFRRFALSNPTVLTDVKVLKAVDTTHQQLSTVSQPRQAAFSQTLNEMFDVCTTVAPYSLFAAIFDYVSGTTDTSFKNGTASPLMRFTQLLPTAFRETFINEYLMKASITGAAKYVHVTEIPSGKESMLLRAAYIREHPEQISRQFDKLLESASTHTLMLAWSGIAMSSMAMAHDVVSRLVCHFLDTARRGEGIFGSKPDRDSITQQAAIVRFVTEHFHMGRNNGLAAELIFDSLRRPLLHDPAAVSCVYPLAYLSSLVLGQTAGGSLSPSAVGGASANSGVGLGGGIESPVLELTLFVFRLIFLAQSFMSEPSIFKHVDRRDLMSLECLVAVAPGLGKLIAGEAGKSPRSPMHSGSLSNVSALSQSSYSRGRVPRAVAAAMGRAQANSAAGRAGLLAATGFLTNLATFCLCSQLHILTCYSGQGKASASVQRLLALNQLDRSNLKLSQTLPIVWALEPCALPQLCEMPGLGETAISVAASLMDRDVMTAAGCARLALVFNRSARLNKGQLSVFAPLPGSQALCLLKPDVMKEAGAARYVVRCLAGLSREEGLLFLPQLVQALRFDACGLLLEFLEQRSKADAVFCHYLLWNILSEKNNHVSDEDTLPQILGDLERRLQERMTEAERRQQQDEFALIDRLDEVSQQLLPLEIPDRPPALYDALRAMALPDGLYVPSNPNYRIVSIDAEHSVPLKSHARVPILVRFNVTDENDRRDPKPVVPFSCIFKIHDDVRQDAMMIQFIDRFDQIFKEAGIDCFLFPYRVFATGENRGVLEVIPGSKSRHDIGTATNEDLLTYFINKYGQVGTEGFERAQKAFIASVAPYSLICYLFQVKDRHNANIMLDEEGHVIHIDFGFIFEISPGGGLKFERAPFKLTREMIDVMGGSRDAPAFQSFVGLLTRCFFAARARHEEIEAIADLMRSAGFPCFRADSIKKLRERFCVDRNPKDVIGHVQKLIDDSYEAVTTTGYDAFQASSNHIYF